MAQSRGDRRAGHRCTTRRFENRLHLGGGPRIPSAPPRPTWRLSASPREFARHGGDALPVLAASTRPARHQTLDLEARAEPTTQDRVRHSPSQLSTVRSSGDEADRTPSRSRLLPVGMARAICPVQHRATQKSRQPVREGLFKTDEQRHLRQDNGESAETHEHQAGERRKGDSQVLRATTASRLPAVRVGGCHPPPEDGAHARPPPVRRLHDSRAEQVHHIRLPLRIRQVNVRGASAATIHRHRLALLRDRHRRRLS